MFSKKVTIKDIKNQIKKVAEEEIKLSKMLKSAYEDGLFDETLLIKDLLRERAAARLKYSLVDSKFNMAIIKEFN